MEDKSDMKILVIDEEFPYPPNTGKRIRSFNLLKRLASTNDLHYLAYGTTDSESFGALNQHRMNPIPVKPQVPPKSGFLFYFRLFLNLFSSQPYIVSSHYSDLFDRTLRKAVIDLNPDIIICEWTPYAVFVEKIENIKKLVVAHNVETRIWQRYFENEKQALKRWYIGKQVAKLERFERAVFKYIDGVTAVSDIDADQIHSYNHQVPVEVVDNGVDLEFFDASSGLGGSNKLVFVGTMDWRPNQDCVQYFIEDILPLIHKERPEIEAVFVGRNPPTHIKALDAKRGVTVTGSVDDVRPYIKEGDVYIVPLRIGGGTRLKILDALAMRKAVVSTTVGAEGLDLTDGVNILIADTPDRFAAKILRLLDDPKLAITLGESGRKLVEEKYGWDGLVQKLEKFIIRLVESK